MSANNMYFAKRINGIWHGWSTDAEESIADDGTRKLYVKKAELAESINDLEERLNGKYMYSEYGLTLRPYLAKDGLPIEVVA